VVSVKETKTLARRCLSSSMLSYKTTENISNQNLLFPPAAQTGHNEAKRKEDERQFLRIESQ
jgi:hypothetical protein